MAARARARTVEVNKLARGAMSSHADAVLIRAAHQEHQLLTPWSGQVAGAAGLDPRAPGPMWRVEARRP
jgi:hypothetical protein